MIDAAVFNMEEKIIPSKRRGKFDIRMREMYKSYQTISELEKFSVI